MFSDLTVDPVGTNNDIRFRVQLVKICHFVLVMDGERDVTSALLENVEKTVASDRGESVTPRAHESIRRADLDISPRLKILTNK